MQYAIDGQGTRITATKASRGICPQCSNSVIAKCGEIVVHHWAHEANGSRDCDSWWENESEWHRSWKDLIPPARVEATIGSHRADIRRLCGSLEPSPMVVELQHSPISVEEIREREAFYGNMIWLFDACESYAHGYLEVEWHSANIVGPVSFAWKWPRRSIAFCRKRMYVDIGEMVFEVNKLDSSNSVYYGQGYAGHKVDFAGFISNFGYLPEASAYGENNGPR